MTEGEIKDLAAKQAAFFGTGATLPVKFRKRALKALRSAISAREGEIAEAIRKDLGKSAFEAEMTEIRMVLSELTYMIKRLKKFAKRRRVRTPLAQFAAKSCKIPSPYGVTLIMSPWNYPFMLALDPLADALAAGNCAIVKPSAYSPATSQVIKKLIDDVFDPAYVAAVTGGRQENSALLSAEFDYIFFTGSAAVGMEVMRRAAERLTPVTLELGGKSPCIVDKTAKLALAARRIVFGKFLNCGQTCVAPDYVYCDESIKDELIAYIKREIIRQFGEKPLESPDYGKIVNQKHFERICGLIESEKVVFGGQSDARALRIAPTVMDGVTFSDKAMGEEIFGPVLPVLTFRTLEEGLEKIKSLPHPLALYIFTQSKRNADLALTRTGFGGGCVNDVVIHLATSNMPFGGFGESGMGAYHGKAGFEQFSHCKSVVYKRTWFDLPVRYRPYTGLKRKLMRTFMK